MANESRKRLWPDEDEWLDFFCEYRCGHPELAEHVARIWFAVLEHNSQGPEGVRNARFILSQAPRSTVEAARLSVYPVIPPGVPALPLSLTGYVKPEDKPEHLLKASIARAKASIADARKSKRESKD